MEKKRTAAEVYFSGVFRWGIIILVSACMCAAVMFTTEKFLNVYPQTSWISVIFFDLMDIAFFISAMFLIKTSYFQYSRNGTKQQSGDYYFIGTG